jgi:phosphatidylserine decarboxylase
MVRDGYYYALALCAVAALVGWLAGPMYMLAPLVLAAFFLWFFRDPERLVPAEAGAVVSPADGKVTAASQVVVDGRPHTRISIFLSVFDVHVNRSPATGEITHVEYRPGQFRNALGDASADTNEQNIVTLNTGGGQVIIFKQIAGLLARRIVFTKRVGDRVERGERIGMIKFGSRMDVLLDPPAQLRVAIGDHVRGGSSVLALVVPAGSALGLATAGAQPQKRRL